jgi:hypothetical protein
MHHPSRRLDLQSLLAIRPISPNHSLDLIDNLYLTGDHSTDLMTTGAFMIHLLIPKPTPMDKIDIIAAQFKDTSKQGIHTSPDQQQHIITLDSMNNTFDTTFLDDEQIASGTYVTSPHLDGTPHAHVVTLPTFSPAAYGLTLLASRQLRWTTNIPQTSIPSWIPDSLHQSLLNQSPTVTRANVDRMLPAKDTCTIYSKEFRGLNAIVAFGLFRAAVIPTLYRYLFAVEHMQHNSTATSVDQLSRPTQALLHAMDSVQPARD